MLLLQRANGHIVSIIETLHYYGDELARVSEMSPKERAICDSMSEILHFLLELAAERATNEDHEGGVLERMTGAAAT